MPHDAKPQRGEILWTEYRDSSGVPVFVMTSKESRDVYFLYEVSDGELKRLGKGKTPTELEEKYDVNNRMQDADRR